MIPTLVIGSLWYGIAFLLQPAARTSSPAYDGPKALMPIHWWGWLFVAVALLTVTGMISGRRVVLAIGVAATGTLFGTWTGFVAASIVQSSLVGLNSVIPNLIVTIACTAVIYSLVRDKVTLTEHISARERTR
jgi:hypothetical protein